MSRSEGDDDEQEQVGGRHFVASRTRPSRRWLVVFGSLMVVILASASGLTYVGVRTVRDSRAGKSVSTVNDGPFRSSSTRETRKRGSRAIAAVNIASLSSALATGPSCFNGERRAGTKYTRSSSSSSSASFAIAR